MRKIMFLFAVMLLAVAFQATAAAPEVPRVTPQELKAKLDRGEKVVILDTRTAGQYNSSDVKIKGAVRMAFQEIDQRASELDPDSEIVAYCT